ncbi:MAG: diguanylate cyclase [Geodermatophilaceae bacterium]
MATPGVGAAHGRGLVGDLRAAVSVAAACLVVVDHLLSLGMTLPSLYLERGGRLRCQAARGYWLVFDGMPMSAGVIGTTFRSGQPVELRGVSSSRDYLAAAPAVLDEVCVPIRLGGRVVGALNVESVTGLPAEAMTVTAAAAAAFAERLAELGGATAESALQRLARHTTLIAAAETTTQLWAAACAAAMDLTGGSSAAIVPADRHTANQVGYSVGPIADRLVAAASAQSLAAVAGWVASGSSCWSRNDPDGSGFPGGDALREAGAAAVLAVHLPPASPGGNAGFLLVADEQAADLATEVIQLLELLGTHVTSCARTLDLVAALRRQASRDPLTDLGHHAAYHAAVTAAMHEDRSTGPVAVLMADIDSFKAVNDQHGHPAGDTLLRTTAKVLTAALRGGDELYRIGGDEFATVLRDTTAAQALIVAERLRVAAHDELGATISIGVAIAHAGEPQAALLARADRALYQVKRDGRNGVLLAAPHLTRTRPPPPG